MDNLSKIRVQKQKSLLTTEAIQAAVTSVHSKVMLE